MSYLSFSLNFLSLSYDPNTTLRPAEFLDGCLIQGLENRREVPPQTSGQRRRCCRRRRAGEQLQGEFKKATGNQKKKKSYVKWIEFIWLVTLDWFPGKREGNWRSGELGILGIGFQLGFVWKSWDFWFWCVYLYVYIELVVLSSAECSYIYIYQWGWWRLRFGIWICCLLVADIFLCEQLKFV